MTTSDRRVVFSAAVVAALLGAAPARADDQAAARALFNDARTLMKSAQYAQACPKLEAASKLYAGSGILINLGDCYEHLGRTASAWTEFGEAATAAERAGRDDNRDEAARRQRAVESKLSRLAIRVASPAPGIVVKRDDLPIEQGAWGVAIPVDPGTYGLSAAAPDRQPWSRSVSVTDAGSTVTVDVPELAQAPTPPAEPVAPPPLAPAPATDVAAARPSASPSYWTPRRVAAGVTTGVGVLGAAMGGVIGLVALSQYDSAKNDATGAQRHDDSTNASNLGNVATVFVAIGAAVTVSGVILWLTAPDAAVQVGTTGTGALVRGAF